MMVQRLFYTTNLLCQYLILVVSNFMQCVEQSSCCPQAMLMMFAAYMLRLLMVSVVCS